MSLSNLMREIEQYEVAIAIPAIVATDANTDETDKIARIATIAVANPTERKTAFSPKPFIINDVTPVTPQKRYFRNDSGFVTSGGGLGGPELETMNAIRLLFAEWTISKISLMALVAALTEPGKRHARDRARLADYLRRFGIEARNIVINGFPVDGFELEQFAAAFDLCRVGRGP